MTYKYEDEIKSIVYDYSKYLDGDQILDEVDDVYAKAKAWDKYLADVENSVREVTGNEDEVKWHVDYAVNEYMEGK